MIQDIEPRKFKIGYEFARNALINDKAVFMKENKILVNPDGCIPTFNELGIVERGGRYLFKIDDIAYFYCGIEPPRISSDFKYVVPSFFRTVEPQWEAFGGITAAQVARFYTRNRFCGVCGKPLYSKDGERALVCKECGNIVYPKISPAIIVGIIDGNKLLMTKYTGREFTRYALVAGFTEIGETPEDTVKREVMEEVGLEVKDITYYKSQPWAFSESLLIGFFAHLEGTNSIRLDTKELSCAEWVERNDIPQELGERSLTREMINAFKDGLIG